MEKAKLIMVTVKYKVLLNDTVNPQTEVTLQSCFDPYFKTNAPSQRDYINHHISLHLCSTTFLPALHKL